MKRFIAEIKQRGVHRAAGLYLALVWLVLQAAEILFPAFDIPDSVLRYVLGIGIAGFPLVVLFGWFYEFTDQGIKLEEDVESSGATRLGTGRSFYGLIIVLLALALAASVFVNLQQASDAEPQEVPDNLSILIADMDNRTGDPVFDGSLEQALTIGLEGAPFISAFNRNTALKVADTISDGDGLTEVRARLVSLREGISLVLSGSIVTTPEGLEIHVLAVDPAGGEERFAVSAEAESKLAVLQAVSELSAQIRESLGDVTLADDPAARETFSTATLEAVSYYTLAQTLAGNADYAAAEQMYLRAVKEDPGFGRAYSGLALATFNQGKLEESQVYWAKTLSLLEKMGKRERYRTLGIYYTVVSRNYAKAIENYELLVQNFPADAVGHSNLSVAYFYNRQFDDALKEGRYILQLYPDNPTIHSNYSLYAMYAGDFVTARKEGQALVDDGQIFYLAYLPIAMAELAEGNIDAARTAYRAMAAIDEAGRSLASTGLSDIELFLQNYAGAVNLLTSAVLVDEAVGNVSGRAKKFILLAQAYQRLGESAEARQAVSAALGLSAALSIQLPAARLYVELGDLEAATAIAQSLSEKLQIESRADSDLIRGNVLMAQGDLVQAVDALRASLDKSDGWLAHFDLGRAYFMAGSYPEALSEFEECEQRRGEATAIFLDDAPTYHYMADLQVWLTKTRQKLGMSAQ
jgi:tetratricopeptide (TPR) repeat protein